MENKDIILGIAIVIIGIILFRNFGTFSVYDISYQYNKNLNLNGNILSATSNTDFNESLESSYDPMSEITTIKSYKNMITDGNVLTIDLNRDNSYAGSSSIIDWVKMPIVLENIESISYNYDASGFVSYVEGGGSGGGFGGGNIILYLSSPSKNIELFSSPSIGKGISSDYSKSGKVTIFKNLGSYVVDVNGDRTTITNDSYKLIFQVQTANGGDGTRWVNYQKLIISNFQVVNKPIIVCTENSETCNGNINSKCLNNSWIVQGLVNGKCEYIICTPNWQTGTWTTCSNNLQTRTVTDSNNCGVTTNKPITQQACTPECTPNCDNKCGGVPNGCSGTCNAVCPNQTECTVTLYGTCSDRSIIPERYCVNGKYVNANLNCSDGNSGVIIPNSDTNKYMTNSATSKTSFKFLWIIVGIIILILIFLRYRNGK